MRDYCGEHGIDFISLEQQERFDRVGELAEELMRRISRVVPILPIALMAEVMLDNRDTPKSALEIKADAMRRVEALRAAGAPVKMASSVFEPVLIAALDSLTGRGFVCLADGLYTADDASIVILQYYANSIRQWKPPHPHYEPLHAVEAG
jgi:glycerol-3-phosphate O-acyltransferase